MGDIMLADRLKCTLTEPVMLEQRGVGMSPPLDITPYGHGGCHGSLRV